MRNRRAILFFLAWSAVFALALAALSLGRHPDTEVARSTLSALDVERVSHLEISRATPDGDEAGRMVLSRIDGRWRIEAPISAEADEASVKRTIDAVMLAEPVDELSATDMATMGRSLRDFGLASPRATGWQKRGRHRVRARGPRTVPSARGDAAAPAVHA